MPNKHRAHKAKAPYRRYAGSSEQGSQVVYFGHNSVKKPKNVEFDLPSEPPRLPLHVMELVVSHLNQPQLFNLLLVSRWWFFVAVAHLYIEPHLTSHNYALFVDSLSQSASLGGLVRTLDLSGIGQSGKNSATARLLRRCGSSLEVFVAPQRQFGVSQAIGLKNCTNLRVLDLGLVSETVDLVELLRALECFDELCEMRFPRSSVLCSRYDNRWPRRLRKLALAGGITDDFLLRSKFPSTITDLEFSNCPQVSDEGFYSMLYGIGDGLRRLRVAYPMPLLGADSLDIALDMCPNLRLASLSIDYVTNGVLVNTEQGEQHPLRVLEITTSGSLGLAHKLSTRDLLSGCVEYLCDMHTVALRGSLDWFLEDVESLSELTRVLNLRGGRLVVDNLLEYAYGIPR